MKYLIPILLLFASCNAYKKIAGDTKRTDSETKLLATICAAEFPPIEYISEGTKTVDSTAFKEAYKALEKAIDDAGLDITNLQDLIEQKGQDNEVLRQMLFDAHKKADSLKAVKQAYKVIPCPDSHTRDTSHLEATAKLTALQIKYDKLDRESAAKNIVIDNANAGKQSALDKLKDANKWRWYAIGTWIAIGLAIAGFFTIKLKII